MKTILVAYDEDEAAGRALERDADLIVVGAHRPTIWQRLFGESVDQEVTRRARRDLLIVH